MAADYPDKNVVINRTLIEGDHVVLHCQKIWPEGLEYAGMDISRLDTKGKIVEHWDVLQKLPEHGVNPNEML